MSLQIIDTDSRISHLFEMLHTSHGLNYWIYDNHGKLLENGCNSHALDAFFSAGANGKQEMLQRGQESSLPVLLGLPLGLVWIAAFEREQDTLKRCYVLGPALHTEVSLRDIEQVMITYHIPKNWQQEFVDIIRNLPVLSITSLTRTAIMLHYSITGEKISSWDVTSLVTPEITDQPDSRTKRRNTYLTEQKLLGNVRDGNLNFRVVLSEAQDLGDSVLLHTGSPLSDFNTSLTIFTALCARAAIEGGISPDVAYAMSESYIERIHTSESIKQSESIGHTMYREFIQLVHDAKQRTDLSKPIRNCCDYIGLHLEDELTMDILAHRVGYTVNYLSRKFTEEVGMPPSDYIKKVRIDRACLLLISTDLPIPEIGFRLRFCNRSYFSAVFKGLMGMTPVEYREQYQIL